MTIAQLYGQDAYGNWAPMLVNGLGGSAGGGGSSVPPNPWTYGAPTGGIVNTADNPIAAAAGIGKSNYLSGIQLINGAGGAATEVVIKDGSTVIWRTVLVPSAGISVSFPTPLYSSSNAALNVACITTAAAVYVNAQGFVDATPTARGDAVSPYDELLDDLGGNIFDNNSSNQQIYAVA